MRNKHVGYLVLAITALFFFVVISFNMAIAKIVNTTCSHGTSCPMQITMQTQQFISYGLMLLLMIIGLFITFFMKDETIIQENKKQISEEEKKIKLEHLNEDEKRIMDIIFLKEGSLYQSDLVKETQFNKVKVTRILDRLEGKQLIERKRRGMTNIVILRQK